MNIAPIIRRACIGYGDLALKAGLSPDYIRHLVRPNETRSAGYEARRKLASALRAHAQQIASDADALESGIV